MTTENQRRELLDFNTREYRGMNQKSYDSLRKFNDSLGISRMQRDIFFKDKEILMRTYLIMTFS
jgi:hypothetical protein